MPAPQPPTRAQAGAGAHVRGELQRRHAVGTHRVARLRQAEEAGTQGLSQGRLCSQVLLCKGRIMSGGAG